MGSTDPKKKTGKKSTIEGKKSKTEEETKTQIPILIRDAFGTFKGEVPYYSARIMSIPKFEVPGLEELDEMYEEWIEGEDE